MPSPAITFDREDLRAHDTRRAGVTSTEFRATLRALGMTQTVFAERAGLDISTVSRWSTGKSPIPGWVGWIFRMLHERRELADRLRG